MLCHFQNEPGLAASDLESIEDGREVVVELDVDNGTDDRYDLPTSGGGGDSWCCIVSPC